jgi:hypothetical protein
MQVHKLQILRGGGMHYIYEHAFLWDGYYDSTLISDVLNPLIKV